MNGERMHPTCQLGGEGGVDEAVALDAALSGESRSNNGNPEMRFAAWTRTRMARMQVGFINDAEALGPKRAGKLFLK